MKYKCRTCHTVFDNKPSEKKRGHGKYCSKKCYGIYLSKALRGKNNFLCNGKSWWYGKYRNKKTKIKISKTLKGKYLKEKSPAWKGGRTLINKKIRSCDKYLIWRRSIFIRDNFTCQKCGERGGYLEVHHKKPLCKFITEIKQYLPLMDLYDGALIYKPLWDMDNGITLCKKCHNKTKRGRKTHD